jgi:serine/threonine protein kinase
VRGPLERQTVCGQGRSPPCIRGTITALSDDAEVRAEERVGTVLNDKWTLERLLGVGGMAAVYAARHRNGARAAVKVLHADLSRHAEVRERFLREGYAANSVEHPGAVKVLDDDVIVGGPDSGTAYLVMELLDGESLQERLERSPPMGEREFLAIASSVLEVLEAAHARGVVHRDLKPENLFLMSDPDEKATGKVRVKVLDFGLARLLQGQTITSYGLALGTPSFMSPEQAAGRIDEIDGRTDLFALAATGFRLRTGRRIQEGVNPVELVTRMANVAAPRIRTLAPDASEPFARVVDRALEFRREDRYDSATAMRDDVLRAIAELDAGVTATQLAVYAPAVSPPPAEPTIDLVDGDFEFSQSAQERSQAQTRGFGPQAGPPRDWPEESIRIPRRRSVLPWLALFVFAGIGAKLWLDARKTKFASSGPEAPSASQVATSVGGASAAPIAQARDGGADVGAEAPHNATLAGSAARPPPGSGPPPASTTRPAWPAKGGPGNVRKLPAPHHPSGVPRP